MAGDWIKMRMDLVDDPDVVSISTDTKLDEFEVVGRLHKLWAWADRHASDGLAKRMTLAWLDRYVSREGFARAMQEVGWLTVTDDGVMFCNFDRHNGESAKKRAEDAERKRLSRQNADTCPKPVRKKTDKSVTREEKRREEKSKGKEGGESFDLFWAEYPRKSRIAHARRLWASMGLDDKAGEVMAGLARCKASAAWSKDGGKFVPGVSRWLEDEGWHDQPDPSPARKLDPLAGKSKAELDGLYALACERWPDCKAQGRGSDYTRARMAKLARGAA